MGAAKVSLYPDEAGRLVIGKCPVGDVEYAFYREAAEPLTQAGVLSPELLSVDEQQRKIIIEYIPHKVAQAEVADDEALSMLTALHAYPPSPRWRYHPHGWSEMDLEKSLTLLSLPEKSARQMRSVWQRSEGLFNRGGLISGDSHAGNWGRRRNGERVLFDWERFGTGSPAIDLAPLIKGMGTAEEFESLAQRYARIARREAYRDLSQEIAVAKAWIVTEVVNLLHDRQKSDYRRYLSWYREHLPGWLEATIGQRGGP